MEHVGSLEALGSQLEKFLSTKTVFGEPIVAGKVTLIPIQSVSFGFGSGGGKGATEKDSGGGSGSGGGASLRPLAIVAVTDDGNVQVYTLEDRGVMEKIVEKLPDMISNVKFTKPKKADKKKAKVKGQKEATEECKEDDKQCECDDTCDEDCECDDACDEDCECEGE